MSAPNITRAPCWLVSAEPGDGTRYDLAVYGRHSGGYMVTWPHVNGATAKIYNLGTNFVHIEWITNPSRGRHTHEASRDYDAQAITEILTESFERDHNGHVSQKVGT